MENYNAALLTLVNKINIALSANGSRGYLTLYNDEEGKCILSKVKSKEFIHDTYRCTQTEMYEILKNIQDTLLLL